MKYKYLIFGLLQIILCHKILASSKITMLDMQNTPDDIAFFDENNEKHFLDQYEDKTILLVFWASWCSACGNEIIDLDTLQKDFRKLPFEVLAISQDAQGVDFIKKYFQTHGVRHLKIYYDRQNELFKTMAIAGIPTSILINQDGKMVVNFTGFTNWHDEEVRKIILSNIQGGYPEPKNSYKSPSLNQSTKVDQSGEVEQRKKEGSDDK